MGKITPRQVAQLYRNVTAEQRRQEVVRSRQEIEDAILDTSKTMDITGYKHREVQEFDPVGFGTVPSYGRPSLQVIAAKAVGATAGLSAAGYGAVVLVETIYAWAILNTAVLIPAAGVGVCLGVGWLFMLSRGSRDSEARTETNLREQDIQVDVHVTVTLKNKGQ